MKKQMINKKISHIINIIQDSECVYLASHIQPDGDSIGSILSLGLGLTKKFGDKIRILATDIIPEKFNFLPGSDQIKGYDEIKHIDTLITLDCGDIYRIGDLKTKINKNTIIINIDHHISNTNFGNINIVNPKASSTGEIVYDILESTDIKLDTDIATNIYVAISTDTGSFKYDNTTSKTHHITSKLFKYNIDLKKVNIELYQSRSLEKTKLFIESLNTLDYYNNNTLAVVTINRKMLKKCNAKSQDIDGIIEFIRDTKNVEVACIFKEIEKNVLRVGLRSKQYVDVSAIAEIFGGGGHIRAAGCTIKDNLNENKKMIINEIIKNLR